MIDINPSASFTGQLSDVSQVEKFELSDDAYAQRTGLGVDLHAFLPADAPFRYCDVLQEATQDGPFCTTV